MTSRMYSSISTRTGLVARVLYEYLYRISSLGRSDTINNIILRTLQIIWCSPHFVYKRTEPDFRSTIIPTLSENSNRVTTARMIRHRYKARSCSQHLRWAWQREAMLTTHRLPPNQQTQHRPLARESRSNVDPRTIKLSFQASQQTIVLACPVLPSPTHHRAPESVKLVLAAPPPTHTSQAILIGAGKQKKNGQGSWNSLHCNCRFCCCMEDRAGCCFTKFLTTSRTTAVT